MLRAGVADFDITPPLGTEMPGLFHERRAEVVSDPLRVRAFALESDGQGMAIAVCDLIGVKRAYLDRVKERVLALTGLEPSDVLVACTHTHTGAATGDDAYTDFLVQRIGDAIAQAWANLAPCEVGFGVGREERVVFNRRYRMRDGTVRTNPGVGNPDVQEPVGPVDPDVGVLGLRRTDGSPLGVLANYALHYIGAADSGRALSADYFGRFARYLPRLLGAEVVAAMSNGACGDINNIDVLGGTRSPNDRFQHTDRVAARLAAEAFWVWNGLSFDGDVKLGTSVAEVTLPTKPPPGPEELARARAIEAMERPTMAERAFVRRITRRMADLPEEIVTWVQALRVGTLGIVGVPGELLVELGLDIKRRSPFADTVVVELANDSIGYIPHRRAYEEGGYEPEASVLAPGCGEAIVAEALRLLDELSN